MVLMRTNNMMKCFSWLILLILLLLVPSGNGLLAQASLRAGALKLTLDRLGRITSLTDLAAGRELLDRSVPAPLLTIRHGKQEETPGKATYDRKKGLIVLDFPVTGVRVTLSVALRETYMTLTVKEIHPAGVVDVLVWGPVPLVIGATVGEIIGIVRDDRTAFGLQVLDNFVNAVIRTLGAELEKFKDNKEILNLVMAYIPELAVTTLYKKNRETDNQILIGNKAYFLKQLRSFGLPVPPGFVITTEVFRGYEGVKGYQYIFEDLQQRINRELRELERITKKTFGDPKNPLILSVRSGATISLPGMMSSFLNVGINETIAKGLARKNDHRWAAWDSYRRFLQTWGMFQGLERNFFDQIMINYKSRYTVEKKYQFKPDQMRQLALAYRESMKERGIEITDDPHEQLQHAIQEVFASWNSEQARIYRHQMHLSDEWGTAVIVQAMVFGNLHENSGSGVILTRDPRGSSQQVAPYGDFIFCVQGDDIVSGLVATYPISEKQRIAEQRDSPISLEMRFPEIYHELVKTGEFLVYEKGFNHQEVEFTFENATKKGLYILQTRDMVQRETQKVRSFVGDGALERSFLGMGIGVSGGALAGRAVYSEEEIARFRDEEPETPLILIRPDTVPDDVGIILKVDGILTARGGGTSHAAVTIPQLNKVGVVGFNKLHVYESDGYSRVDGSTIRGGDFISIDGWSGAVYAGKHRISADESYKIIC